MAVLHGWRNTGSRTTAESSQNEIRSGQYREYWLKRKLWSFGDGIVAALAGSQIGSHHGAAAGVLGTAVVFVSLEAMWAVVFYIGRAFLRRGHP